MVSQRNGNAWNPLREKLPSMHVKNCPLVSTIVLELKHASEFGFIKSYHCTQSAMRTRSRAFSTKITRFDTPNEHLK